MLLGETNGPAGFVLAGPTPGGCPVGDGTRWQNPGSPGSGLWNFNFLRREGFSPGCINFPGVAHAGLYFSLGVPCRASADRGWVLLQRELSVHEQHPHGGCRNETAFAPAFRIQEAAQFRRTISC